MVEQCVDERAVEVARGGVDDHAGGFVDDDQMLVLIGDDETQVLRDVMRRGWGGKADRQRRGYRGLRRRVPSHRAAFVGDAAALDQRLPSFAREGGARFGERPVEPTTAPAPTQSP